MGQRAIQGLINGERLEDDIINAYLAALAASYQDVLVVGTYALRHVLQTKRIGRRLKVSFWSFVFFPSTYLTLLFSYTHTEST